MLILSDSGRSVLRLQGRTVWRLTIQCVATGLFVWGTECSAVGAVAAAGRVASLQGRVLIRNDAAASAVRTALPGASLSAGDVINTASDGSVKLLMNDQTILDIGPSSLFKIDSWKPNNGADRQVGMTLNYGKLRALVNQKVSGGGQFKLKTPSATMGVRGTEFVVDSGSATASDSGAAKQTSQTSVTVLHGEVAVSDPQRPSAPPVPVTEGKQLTTQVTLSASGHVLPVARDAPAPQVVAVSPAEIAAARASATVVDNTFTQNVEINASAGNGADTMALVTNSVTMPAAQPMPHLGDMGFNGGFSADTGLGGAAYYPGVVGTTATVKVTFSR